MKARKINAVIWTAIQIALTGGVMYQWSEQGCGFESLVAAWVVYTAMVVAIAAVCDQTIKEAQQ